MQARDPAGLAAARLRSVAPVAAFATPVVLLMAAMVVALAASEGAALWLLALAAPTVVAATLVAGGVPGAIVLVVSAAASGPLWWAVGRGAAARALATAGGTALVWRRFWTTYATVSIAWVVAATAFFAFWRQ